RPKRKQARNQRRHEEATEVSVRIARPVGTGDGGADEQRDRELEPGGELTADECGEKRGALSGCAVADAPDERDCDDEAQGIDDEQRGYAADGAPRVAPQIFRGPVRRAAIG